MRETVKLLNQVEISKLLRINSCSKPLLFDLYLFDKSLGLVGTGLEVRQDFKGTVKWR